MTVADRSTGEDQHVDDLRQQLRALGYLDAGVNRFVLAPAFGTRRPIAIAGLASLRIGILGALLFGPASTFWIHERLPGLITGTRDAIVITAYLSALFGLAATSVAFLASLGVSWLARNPGSVLARQSRVLSVAAGVLVTCSCLVYLTIWWQQASAAGAGTRIGLAMALLFSVAISLLLGHAVTVMTLALIVARSGTVAHLKGVPGASWKVTLGAAAIAICGALLLLNFTAPFEQPAVDAPKLTVVPSGVRVRLLAIDGFDDAIFAELMRDGRVPALAAAIGGARARISTATSGAPDPAANDPARNWTTIATGQPPAVHGVESLETRRLAGVGGTLTVGRAVRAATDLVRLTRPSIASGTERREKTFWEVAAEAGLRTAVVNWWATWPAPADSGVILSDRATLRLEHGGTLDAEIAPADVYQRLRARWLEIRSQAASSASQVLTGVEPGANAALLQRSAELDALQLALAREVSRPDTDLLVVYLPGLDIAQHTLLSGDDGPPAPSALAARLEALKQYYVALDRLLSPMLASEPDVVTFTVTASGRVTTGGSTAMAVRGAVAQAATQIDGHLADIAPTVLYALGVPVSTGLAGAPLLGLFSEDFTRRYPVREVSTYGQPSTRRPARTGQPLDQEAIDRLRSLGYVR